MKNYAIILFVSVGLLFSCTGRLEKQQVQIDLLETENQEMLAKLEAKDSLMLSFFESLSGIEQNLIQIKERELNISVQNTDLALDNVEERNSQILNDIRAIDQLIVDNKNRISKLNRLLGTSRKENGLLTKRMTDLKNTLEAKLIDQENAIVSLKKQLDNKIIDMDILLTDMEILRDEKEYLNYKLSRGYYVSGDFKTLKAKTVINKKGGFLGIGKHPALVDNFETREFTEVDIRESVMFPIVGRKVELMTPHNKDSYEIKSDTNEDTKLLIISDPEKFWEKSNYLVMLTKN